MPGKIKCTYETCFAHFKSQESMIKHKANDGKHDYCKRCNVDCEDESDYCIHQMKSPKHIACCVCFEEFRSEAGRDSHVELFHQRSQNLPCPGCAEIFNKASGLVSHIENDECKVISLEAFNQQRAEKSIQKDAWKEALDPNRSLYASSQSGVSEGNTQGGGVSLLDNDHSNKNGNWQGGAPQSAGPNPLQPSTLNSRYTAPRPFVESNSLLSLDKFPSLPTQNKNGGPGQTKKEDVAPADGGDLLDFNEPGSRSQPAPATWGGNASALFQAAQTSILQPPGSDSSSSVAHSSNINPSNMDNMLGRLQLTTSAQDSAPLPPAAKPENNDPNAPYATVRTTSNVSRASTIDPYNYYDSIQKAFVCPGSKCGGKFATPEAFREHLLTGAHVGGKTTCPSCLRKFGTTAALIAHCESPTRKCTIRKSTNYHEVIRELTAGLLGTDGHLVDGTVKYVANKVQDW